MAIAAVPAYLGKDFSQASPGLRFGMYLPLWQDDGSLDKTGKTAALKVATRFNGDDLARLQALARRQSALANALAERGLLLSIEARAVAPFTTGLGNEHPLENGFAFLNPYGLPYLPGSGVKGVLRQSARELASGEWGDQQGWNDAAIDALFGKASDDGDTEHQRGALNCWDVIPQLAGDALQVEVMTPHQSHYYQERRDPRSGDSTSPHESGQPNPINFLTVPPGSGFAFHLQCDVPFLTRLAPELAVDARWQTLLQAALGHAFQWLGFGAKTAVGYGAMERDEERARLAVRQREQRRQQQEEQRLAADREAQKQQMSPADKAIADLFDARIDKNQDERVVLFNALKAVKLGEHRVAGAQRLQALMQATGRWREKTEKKNPDKDQPYQDTLLVKKWLAP